MAFAGDARIVVVAVAVVVVGVAAAAAAEGRGEGGGGVGVCFERIFSFGDSLTDTGNFLLSVPEDFPDPARSLPYGQTFFGRPSGRYSDGRNLLDFFGLVNKEEDGAIDSDFDLLYDDMDGVRYFLGEVPWEIFITTVKRIYIVPAEQQNENEYQEEEEDNAAAAAAAAAADEDGDGNGASADDGVAAAADEADDHGYTTNDDPSFD